MIVKRQPHASKHGITRSISYRLPENIIEELETEAQQKEISQNVLVRQILQKHIEWERFEKITGMIPVPREILRIFGEKMDGATINETIQAMIPSVKEWVMFKKGGYDLKKTIESMEEYIRASGMTSDHRIEGDMHHFIIQHELGIHWSIFTELLLKQIFREFLPNLIMKTRTTPNTVIASIALGSDFNEHSG